MGKNKAQPSVPADICKRFSILLLNSYGQEILKPGCFFKELSSLYISQAGTWICAPRLTVSFDDEARNYLNPDGLKYSPCGRCSPWLPFFSQQASLFVKNYCRDVVEVISGL